LGGVDVTPPTGHPYPQWLRRPRDLKRKGAHVSKKGRLVTRRALTKSGRTQKVRIRQKTIEKRYRRVFASVPKSQGTTGVRKGASYLIPTQNVLEVVVYGLARTRSSDLYDTLDDEANWTFQFRPSTDPDRVTAIIAKEFDKAGVVVVDTAADNPRDAYRPFTIASEVVDRMDAHIIVVGDLPGVVQSKIAAMEWTKPGGKRKR